VLGYKLFLIILLVMIENTVIEHSMYFYTAIYNYVLDKDRIGFDEAKEQIALTKLIQELFDEMKQKLVPAQQMLVLAKTSKQCVRVLEKSHFWQSLKLWRVALDTLDKLRASINDTCI
jgi:hypothetical protein